MRTSRLFVIACVTLVGAPRVRAQPEPPREHEHEHRKLPPTARPTVEPPPLREEKITPRPGFVWLGGHWDWRDGKWAWMPGRWEKERPGKKWRPARWERKDKELVLVEGDWIDEPGGGTAVVVGLGGPTEAPPPPREERLPPRAGFVYVPGRWDWKDKRWVWMPGRFEKERAGKKWRPARWELRGKEYALVEGDWIDEGAPIGVVVGIGPLEPPPAPREERITPRPGFVYIPGRWDWKDKRWEWMPGRFEKVRTGKKWRPARWELRDKQYALVEGEWIDEGAPIAVGEPPPGMGEHHRIWKLDRPTVSSYWPLKGKVGSRIVIHGRNFPPDAMVVWNGEPVKGARVAPEEIVVVVPPSAASGDIAIRRASGRDLFVGPFEVKADFDPDAEARRLEAERLKRAEEAWAARQKELAKDRTTREAALVKYEEERAASRERRRAERLAAIQAKWAKQAFLADPDTQSELTLHAQRVAKLERMREVAEIDSNGKLVIRIDVALNKENDRHDQRMAALEASFKAKGGAP